MCNRAIERAVPRISPGTAGGRRRGGAKGLGTGFWWSAIAMTQAGAAQNAPATLPGRVAAIGWMIASVIAIAVFTAGITSTLTKRELHGTVHSLNDLRSVRVGAATGSATVDYLNHHRIAFSSLTTPEEALNALQAGSSTHSSTTSPC